MPSSNEIKRQNQLLKQQQDILQSIQSTITGATAQANSLSRAMQTAVSHATQLGGDMSETARNTNEAADHAQELGSNLKDAADSGISAMQRFGSSMGQSMQQAADTGFHTITQTMGAIGEVTRSFFSFQILAGFSALFTMVLSNFEKTTAELRAQLGTVFTAPEVNNNLNQFFSTFEHQIISSGLSFEEVVNNAQIFSSEFGVGVSRSAELAFNIVDGSKALGVSADIMTRIVGGFNLAFNISTDQAQVLSEQVGMLAAMNDVAPRAVLQDIAESTEDMARFSAGGVKNFIKTAIQARKLGLSIKDVANTMNGLLNFEDSLNKELQASVMLGRRLNLNEARRAAFAGDTAGAMEAIASQLEGVDLEGLSPLQLQAVAEAANMSVSQIMKLTKGASQLGDVGTDGMESFDTAILNARDAMTQMNQLTADFDATMRSEANKNGLEFFKSVQSVFDQVMKTGFFEKAIEFFTSAQKAIKGIVGVVFGELPLIDEATGKLVHHTTETRDIMDDVGNKIGEETFEKPATKAAAIIDLLKNIAKQFINATLKLFGFDTTVDEVFKSISEYFTHRDGKKMFGFFEGVFERIKDLFKNIGEKLGIKEGMFSNLFGGKLFSGKGITESIQEKIKEVDLTKVIKGFTPTDAEGGLFKLSDFINFDLGTAFEKLTKGDPAEIKEKITTFLKNNLPSIEDMFGKLNFTTLKEKFLKSQKEMKEEAEAQGKEFVTGQDFASTVLGLEPGKLTTAVSDELTRMSADPGITTAIEDFKGKFGITKALTIAEDFKTIIEEATNAESGLVAGIDDVINGPAGLGLTLQTAIDHAFERLDTITTTTKFKLFDGLKIKPRVETDVEVGDNNDNNTKVQNAQNNASTATNTHTMKTLLEENNRLLNRILDGIPVVQG